MGKSLALVAVGLLAGAAVMLASKHIDVQVSMPSRPAADPPPAALPGRLPDAVLNAPTGEPVMRASAMTGVGPFLIAPLTAGQAPVGTGTIIQVAQTPAPALIPVEVQWSVSTPQAEPVALFDRQKIRLKWDDASKGKSIRITPNTPAAALFKFVPPAPAMDPAVVIPADSGITEVELIAPPAAPSGVVTLEFQSNGNPFGSIKLIYPAATSDLIPDGFATNKFRALGVRPAELTVYGGFLRAGGRAPAGALLEARIFDVGTANTFIRRVKWPDAAVVPADGKWAADLDLGDLTPNKTYLVQLTATAPGGPTHTAAVGKVVAKAMPGPQPLPVVATVNTRSPVVLPGETTAKFLTNRPTALVEGSLLVNKLAEAELVVSGDRAVVVAELAAGDALKWKAADVPLNGGLNGLKAELWVGATKLAASPFTVDVRSIGPRVESVSPPTLVRPAVGPYVVTVQFTPATAVKFAGATVPGTTTVLPNPETYADTLANYQLHLLNPNGAFTTVTEQPTSAVGNPAKNSVELTLTPVLALGTYRLVISNSITDLYGNTLGQGTTATGPHAAQLTVATPPPAPVTPPPPPPEPDLPPSVGITGQSAKQNPLPEYLPPRTVPPGFNPADKVESRVVRLYYNRDAHRVAQIIRRDLKSYNRTSVDTRHRAADRARDVANLTTAERAAAERSAIRSTEAARAAEAKLQAAQASLLDLRDEELRARDSLTQAQLRLQSVQDPARPVRDNSDLLRQDVSSAETAVKGFNAAVITAGEQQELRRVDKVQAENELAALKQKLGVPGAVLIPGDQALLAAAEQKAQQAALQHNQSIQVTAFSKTQEAAAEQVLVAARDRLFAAQQQGQAARDDVRALTDAVARQQVNLQRPLDASRRAADSITALRADIQAARTLELTGSEKAQVKQAEELRTREDQFRKEVAALKEDPDSYADAYPDSPDPVFQTSITVMGEGLLQIRGPMKGLNVVRMMVNQMDSPVGQVRVAIHTVQVNGERAERMEKVVAGIQTHIDHTRFMTSRTAQMLRKAVVAVAARKAGERPGGSEQADRDERYVYSFFGKDFVDELKALDSEFLRSGNKLLSLHSMDTTSLASALFLMALAKNSVRVEIVEEFRRQLMEELPRAEMNFLAQGSWNSCTHGCKDKLCKQCVKEQFMPLSANANFESLIGFFSEEITGDDTMAPVQREFIKLAQIYKARLVTELELKQRVLERSLVEDRTGTGKAYGELLDKVRKDDMLATEAQQKAANELSVAVANLTAEVIKLHAHTLVETETLTQPRVDELIRMIEQIAGAAQSHVVNVLSRMKSADSDQLLEESKVLSEKLMQTLKTEKAERDLPRALAAANSYLRRVQPAREFVQGKKFYYSDFSIALLSMQRRLSGFKNFNLSAEDLDRLAQAQTFVNAEVVTMNKILGIQDGREPLGTYLLKKMLGVPDGPDTLGSVEFPTHKVFALFHHAATLVALHRRLEVAAGEIRTLATTLSSQLKAATLDLTLVTATYRELKVRVERGITPNSPLDLKAKPVLEEAEKQHTNFVAASAAFRAARFKASLSRKPLDYKKFLDLLVDETEDKYIEQLEGTRAHTANIDNYVKRIATALEDDFNRQFYHPGFRCVRRASQSWDVNVAQVETTTVLTNNRYLAKVSPAATFEFDLPKRDIFIQEAMRGAKAAVDDYGALLNDPTFLALVKLRSGQPTSSPVQGLLAGSPVRNVLPGLPTDTDERIMAQQAPGRRELASQLESLIPDPAVYKFETGTGFEIRPVLSPDGQSVVFAFNYLYSTKIREPIRPDEKHLGRVDRHFINTDVQLGNYELREISKYNVGLKVSRTGQGVQLLQDIPAVGLLFRPAPSAESSLQQNIVLGQSTIFPTIFDLMGLRYAPAVADMDPLRERVGEFVGRGRALHLKQRVIGIGSTAVDDALDTNEGARRLDLYHDNRTIPTVHPDGYNGPGANRTDSRLQEGYDLERVYPPTPFVPTTDPNGGPARRMDGPIKEYSPALELLPPPAVVPQVLPAPAELPFGRARGPAASPPSDVAGRPRSEPPPWMNGEMPPPPTGPARPFLPPAPQSIPATPVSRPRGPDAQGRTLIVPGGTVPSPATTVLPEVRIGVGGPALPAPR